MTDLTIYAGEDFAVVISASDDDGTNIQDLSDYDMLVQLSVDSLGANILASSSELYSGIDIQRDDDNGIFTTQVSHELTATLPEGLIYLSVMLINKTTNFRHIAEIKTIYIKHSKLAL